MRPPSVTPQVTTVGYGDHPDQIADLYLPTGVVPPTGWPVVVLVHGGFWREMYRRDLVAHLAEDLAARGFAAWNVEYRRVGGDGGWPATLVDVARAVDHLGVLGGEPHLDVSLDLDRVAIVGHSAGGHLALWTAGRASLPAGDPGASPRVRPTLVVGQAPVADLEAALPLGDGAVRDLLGGGPDEVPDRYAVADPVRLVGHGVRVMLTHGDQDDSVPIEQSERYADAARAAGDDVTLVTAPGDHFAVTEVDGGLWAAVVTALGRI